MNKRIWLITGISSGLGKSLAESILATNDFVIGTFRKQAQVEEFNQKYKSKGFAYLLDITDLEGIEKLSSEIEVKFGKADILVNNAGLGMVGAVEETSIREVREIFEANFFGTLKMTQAILPMMRKAKSGHIFQISSHGGLKAFAGFGIYNASKFALEGFSEAIAQELAPLGIKVTIVEPGPFRTNFAGNALKLAEKEIEDYAETAGVFRGKLKGVHGKQEGNPDKAAQAIIDMANNENPTLRLPLGKTALMTIGMKLESVKNDLEQNKAIAESAVF